MKKKNKSPLKRMLLNEGGGTATRTILFLLSEGRESTTGEAAFANSWSFHPAMLEMLAVHSSTDYEKRAMNLRAPSTR
jgi:hypothetical protein